jgi:hypothetical protein
MACAQQVASDSRDRPFSRCARAGNPVTSTPVRTFAERSRHLLAQRVAVASLRRQAHGLRPRSHPRTLGRPQGSARSLQKRQRRFFRSLAHRWSAAAPPALSQNR